MSTNVLANFPSITAPIALPDGQIHPAWQQLLVKIFNSQQVLAQNIQDLTDAVNTASQDGALLVPPHTQNAVTLDA